MENAKLTYLHVQDVKVPMIYERSEMLPIISMKIVIKSSGALQNGKKAGLSRFVGKMLEEGTKDLGAIEFAKALEDKAINFGVVSGAETLNIELNSLKENFAYGTKMLSKLLKNPNITKESLQKVKTFMLGQILGKKSDFDYLANKQLQEVLYKGTPLQYTSLGNEESIESIDLKDVKEFLSTHLDLENAMVVIGGDLDEFEAQKFASSVLAYFPKGKKRKIEHFQTSAKEEIKVLKEQTEQAYIYFGSPYNLKSSSKDAYRAKVSAFILGSSGFGSRLMEEIRVKRGLAYSAYGRINLEHSHSEFMGYLQTKNENKEEAIKIVKEVIKDFVQKGVTNDELIQAKKFLLGSEPLRNETLSQRLNRAYIEIYHGFNIGYIKEELALIENLKLDDLNAFIKTHGEIEKISFSIVTNEDK